MHHRPVVVLVLCLLLSSMGAVATAGPPAPRPASGPSDLVLTDAGSLEELRDLVRILEEHGAVLRHLFPPDTALGRVPREMEPSRIEGLAGRVQVLRDPAEPAAAREAERRPDLAGVWRRLASPEPVRAATETPAALTGDALEAPPSFQAMGPAGCGQSFGSSLYLVGDVSIGIVMPESSEASPNSETWDPARQDQVVAEIVQSGSVLAEQVLPWAGLDFVYDVQRSVPVDVEPIELPPGQAGVWAREALVHLGHASTSAYVDSLRRAHGTDWAVAAFVADDLNDPDNRFADSSRFAFAYIGGPSLWMTYDNDGWGIDRMDTVFAHELGHSFRALDEYAAAEPRCTSRSGVFGVENQNADAVGGCIDDVGCVMKATSMTSAADGSDPAAALLTGHCSWSLGQMGAWDRDGDDLADVRNVPPQSFLDAVDPHPVTSADLTLEGWANARPDPAEVPADGYAGHTLNRLARVDYRLDGGAWVEASGSWGETCGDFQVELTGLAEGWHTVETRAAAAICEPDDIEICDPPRERLEESFATVDFYVNTDCADDPFEENDRPGQAVSIPAGTLAGLQICAFDLDHYGVWLRGGASIDVVASYDDPAAPLELALLDPGGRELERTSGSAGSASLSWPAVPVEGRYTVLVRTLGEAETPYDLFVDAACIDDRLEPNATAVGAVEVAPGLHGDLQLCDGDEDWYVVAVGEGSDITASVSHPAAVGDLDLALLAADGTLIDESATAGDLETVSGTGLPGGLYRIRVRGASPQDDNRYDLEVDLTGCRDDLHENNDTAAEAAPLPNGLVQGLRLCPQEDDWYEVEVSQPSFLRVEAFFVDALGNLDLEVRSAAGTLLGSSMSSSNGERIDLQRVPAGTYRIRVLGRDGAANGAYSLQTTQADPVLLFVDRREEDVLLDWSEAGVDCYRILRNTRPDTFEGALLGRTGIEEDGQEEAGEARTAWDDLAAVDGTALYFYKVFPDACAGPGSLLVLKTFEPYPYIPVEKLREPTPHFTVTVVNEGDEELVDLRIYDDIPWEVAGFTVAEMPAGAQDLSEPDGGAFGRGFVDIRIPSLNPGERAVVDVEVALELLGTSNDKAAILRNQAVVTATGLRSGPLEVLSDDPATLAYPDSTDTALPLMSQPGQLTSSLLVRAFWHQDVEIALRVEDPCGNQIGSEDAASAVCNDAEGFLTRIGGCGDVWPWSWVESVDWPGNLPAASGTYRISLRLLEDRDDTEACLHTSPEDVIVVVEAPGTPPVWTWVVLEPEDTGWQEVLVHELP